MKKSFYLAVFAVFAGLTGCNHFRKEDLKVTVYKDTAVVIPSPETRTCLQELNWENQSL